MSYRFVSWALPAASVALPAVAFAQSIEAVFAKLAGLINGAVGLFITLAIVIFFWGLIKYLWSISSEEAHKGLSTMFFGIIAIFIMVSVWGIVALLQNSFGIRGGQELQLGKIRQ